ncbi:aldo/keto reductase [Paenibacillus sp. LjRoot56]|uniref:aldo/keto reductase n=1 Tax=Paenibacillus sp. LjRoot56 TaxID=3342333 RepID=UPI003ED0C33C
MKLGIGTVQFGVNYGISNSSGQTKFEEVVEVLREAQQRGVVALDTAALYGSSEYVLGQALQCLSQNESFEIITKTSKCAGSSVEQSDADNLSRTFYESLEKLGQSSVYGLLMHQATDLLLPGGEQLYEVLLQLKKQGLVKKIGVSVYAMEEIEQVLIRYPIDLIQIPMNVLDQRLVCNGALKKMKELDIEIHVRSSFLQGLLLMDTEQVPKHFDSIRTLLVEYHSELQQNRLSAVQGALSFVNAFPEVDRIICGVNDRKQFIELVEAIKHRTHNMDFKKFAVDDVNIINPALWKL